MGPLPPPYGGDRIHVANLCRELSRRVEVVVINDKPYCHREALGRAQARCPLTTIMSLDSKKELNSLIRTAEYNLKAFRLSGVKATIEFSATSLKYLKLGYKPWEEAVFYPLVHDVLDEFNVDVIHAHHAHTRAMRALVIKEALRIEAPLIITVHGGEFRSKRRNLAMTKLVMERAERVIVPSEFMRHLVYKLGINARKVVKIPNGVDTEFFKPLNLKGNKGVRILFVGLVCKEKGVYELLRVFHELCKRYRNVKLTIVGRGELELVRELARNLGISDRVKLMGQVPHHQMPLIYNSADIFVLPSHFESFGIAALEAMSCGLPVITTYQMEGSHEFVKDGVNGLLIKPGDVDELAKKLSTLIEDEELREELSRRARKTAEEYDWKVIASRVLELYEEAV